MSRQNKVIQELIDKTMKELAGAKKPRATSRSWNSSQGYKFLIQWSNLALLRILIRKLTDTLPRSEYRSKTQIDDAARSTVANIEEGYKRSTTSEYKQFIGYSQGSLEEVKGDIERFLQDGLLKSIKGSSLKDLGIDLKTWNTWCRNPVNSSKLLYFPLNSFKGKYRNLEELKGSDLTYEIFIELINKTDWLLRKLVQSLERKIQNDKLNI
ncbi:hypothetical protein A3D76_00535 [Candidatus Roizmanbacteria bacterium RIFCSPHIGHO2_02_FULL_37_9b]|nr:MAG: hypothetical protein A3D76_00535 [Candidatus Roizmanbacteria bacterium RIFCSPHIGHO2_02_FULL_37_9b]